MRGSIYPFLVILFLFGAHHLISQSDNLRREIERILKYEGSVDFNVVPGFLVGVIDGDSTFRLSFGRETEMDGIYELGSLTKPYVAWLANEAMLSLQLTRFHSVCTFLPDSIYSQEWKDVTLDQIIEHKAGLPRMAPRIGEIESDVQDPYQDYTIELLARDLKEMDPEPGEYSYSHMGYAATHWLFEKVGGLSKFTNQVLTGPFSLHQTSWNVPSDEIAPGHGLDGRPQPPWNTNALQPALGLRSTLNDLMKFIYVLFDGYERNMKRRDPSVLRKELAALSKTGAYKVVDGWFVIRAEKSLVYYHNGRTGGHHVSVAFTPYKRKAVVVISNGAMGSNDLSLLILRMVNQAKNKNRN